MSEPTRIENPPKRWWEGDPRVEPFMIPVKDELHKHGLERSVRASIYNRAYEAVYAAIKKFDDSAAALARASATEKRLNEAASLLDGAIETIELYGYKSAYPHQKEWAKSWVERARKIVAEALADEPKKGE